MTEFCVLGTSATATQVAAALDAPIASSPEEAAAAGMPVLVVIESSPQVHQLEALRQTSPVSAIVAWLLPEATLATLLAQPIPVLVGLPRRDQVEQAITEGMSAEQVREERARTARLAEFERIFTSAPAKRA